MGCDTSAKVDWCANTQNFDQILAGETLHVPRACGRGARATPVPKLLHFVAHRMSRAQACSRLAPPRHRCAHAAGGAACCLSRTIVAQPHSPTSLHHTHQPRKKKKKDKEGKKDKSGSATKLKVAAPARGRPQGRYAKREAGKMVKGAYALAACTQGVSRRSLLLLYGTCAADASILTRDRPQATRRRT
jgi:hypothetical protein